MFASGLTSPWYCKSNVLLSCRGVCQIEALAFLKQYLQFLCIFIVKKFINSALYLPLYLSLYLQRTIHVCARLRDTVVAQRWQAAYNLKSEVLAYTDAERSFFRLFYYSSAASRAWHAIEQG